MLLVSERSVWYDGTWHVRHVTFESNSNQDVRFEFESNLEAAQVPTFYSPYLRTAVANKSSLKLFILEYVLKLQEEEEEEKQQRQKCALARGLLRCKVA